MTAATSKATPARMPAAAALCIAWFERPFMNVAGRNLAITD
jgi:hypothetical protein